MLSFPLSWTCFLKIHYLLSIYFDCNIIVCCQITGSIYGSFWIFVFEAISFTFFIIYYYFCLTIFLFIFTFIKIFLKMDYICRWTNSFYIKWRCLNKNINLISHILHPFEHVCNSYFVLKIVSKLTRVAYILGGYFTEVNASGGLLLNSYQLPFLKFKLPCCLL